MFDAVLKKARLLGRKKALYKIGSDRYTENGLRLFSGNNMRSNFGGFSVCSVKRVGSQDDRVDPVSISVTMICSISEASVSVVGRGPPVVAVHLLCAFGRVGNVTLLMFPAVRPCSR